MGQRICSVDECDGPHKGHGLCGKHYQRLKKYGTTDAPPRRTRVCIGPECRREVDAAQGTGLCRSHYKQYHLGKALTPLLVATKDLGRPDVCTYPDCGRPHKARGYCKSHNEQVKAGRELRPVLTKAENGPCSILGCEARAVGQSFCPKHYFTLVLRWRKYGMTQNSALAMYEAGGRGCAICRTPYPIHELHIDHDHRCCPENARSCGSCVRGFLCMGCNLGIGNMKDDPARLRAAADYLSA